MKFWLETLKVFRIPGDRQGNIKVDLKETEWKIVDWIHEVQNRDWERALVNTTM
jgi:hypothetical protein